jgi:hypothetical protein
MKSKSVQPISDYDAKYILRDAISELLGKELSEEAVQTVISARLVLDEARSEYDRQIDSLARSTLAQLVRTQS